MRKNAFTTKLSVTWSPVQMIISFSLPNNYHCYSSKLCTLKILCLEKSTNILTLFESIVSMIFKLLQLKQTWIGVLKFVQRIKCMQRFQPCQTTDSMCQIRPNLLSFFCLLTVCFIHYIFQNMGGQLYTGKFKVNHQRTHL